MITIQQATLADAGIIHQLAEEIWWPTYRDYIPPGQISLMLELIYTEEALQQQMRDGQHFSLAIRDNIPVAFVGFRLKHSDETVMRIEKIYIHPSEQGKGTGALLINHVAESASTQQATRLELNVNRHNNARHFYEKQGFVIIGEVDTPYHGYTLNDYVMQRHL